MVNWATWNKFQWNINQNTTFSYKTMGLKLQPTKLRPFPSICWWIEYCNCNHLTIPESRITCEVTDMGCFGGITWLGYMLRGHFTDGPLTRYVNLWDVHAPIMPERFPRHQLQRKPLVRETGIHHGTCVTLVPWCMPGSLTRVGAEITPGIPGACATRNFT